MWAAIVAIYPHGGLKGASAIGREFNRARKAPKEDAENGRGLPKLGFRGQFRVRNGPLVGYVGSHCGDLSPWGFGGR